MRTTSRSSRRSAASRPTSPPIARSSAQRRIGEAVVAVGLVGYCIALHTLVVDGRWPRATVAFVLVPWGIAIATLAWRRLPRVAACIAFAAIAVATWAGSAWASGFPERTVLFESVAFNLVLAGAFAGSLAGRGDALITRLARIARSGDVPPRVVAYTRTITAVWAAFFVACAATSALLYFRVSRDAWSLFANLLYWPLVVVFFVGEYTVRRIVLADLDHVSLMTSVRAYAQRHAGAERERTR